jgi:hypothetical protein
MSDLVMDQHGRLGILEDRDDFPRLQPVVHGSERCPDQTGGEERLQEGSMVRSQPPDPVAVRHAQRTKTIGQPADTLCQLTIREKEIVDYQRHIVRSAPGPSLDPRADPEVPGAGAGHLVIYL